MDGESLFGIMVYGYFVEKVFLMGGCWAAAGCLKIGR